MCIAWTFECPNSFTRRIRDQKKFLREITERYSEVLVNEFSKSFFFLIFSFYPVGIWLFLLLLFFLIMFMLQLFGPCQPSC